MFTHRNVDVLSPRIKENMVVFKFGQSTILGDGGTGFISTSGAHQTPSIGWTFTPNTLYTLIVYDMDAPYPEPNNRNSPLIHYMVANIPGTQITQGTTIFPFIAPDPPKDSLQHRFVVNVYSQTQQISTQNITSNRNNFPLQQFVEQNQLKLYDSGTFSVGSIVPTPITARSMPTTAPSIPVTAPSIPVTAPSIPVTAPSIPVTAQFFKSDSTLSDREEKYCRCVLKVGDKQKGACNTERAWFETREGHTCYNPYAVCAKSTRTSSRSCGENYSFETLSDDHLVTYAQLSKIDIPSPYNRSQLLSNIQRWKQQK